MQKISIARFGERKEEVCLRLNFRFWHHTYKVGHWNRRRNAFGVANVIENGSKYLLAMALPIFSQMDPSPVFFFCRYITALHVCGPALFSFLWEEVELLISCPLMRDSRSAAGRV